MPGAALEHLVRDRVAVIGLEHWRQRHAVFVAESLPPRLVFFPDALAIARDVVAGHHLVRRLVVSDAQRVFGAVPRFEEGLADTEDVIAQRPDQALAVRNYAIAKFIGGELPRQPFRDEKDRLVLLVELLGRQAVGARHGQAGELRKRVEHLAESVLVAFRQHRDLAQAVLVQQ